MKKHSFPVLLFVFLISGCSSAPRVSSKADYFPLVYGAKYTYRSSAFGSIGSDLSYEVGRGVVAGGFDWVEFKELGEGAYGLFVDYYYAKDPDGVYEIISSDRKTAETGSGGRGILDADKKDQILKLPVRLGEKWHDMSFAYEITAAEDLKVQGKTYKNCIKVEGLELPKQKKKETPATEKEETPRVTPTGTPSSAPPGKSPGVSKPPSKKESSSPIPRDEESGSENGGENPLESTLFGETDETPMKVAMWLAPGVGLVKKVNARTKVTLIRELVQYKPPGK